MSESFGGLIPTFVEVTWGKMAVGGGLFDLNTVK